MMIVANKYKLNIKINISKEHMFLNNKLMF